MTAMTESEGARWRDVLNARYAASLALVSLGVWLHAADSLIVATMMPAIVEGVGGERLVAWNFALYETGSIVAGAASGLIALRVGIRLPMIVAAVAFAAGCFLSAVAPTMEVLLLGRVAQGLGGGGLVSLAFVSVARLFPEPLMPRVMAVMSMLWGASAFLGPLVGGLFVTYATWRWGFAFFGLQAAVLAVWIGFGLRGGGEAPGENATEAGRLPMRRLALLCLAVMGVAYAGIAASVPLMALSLGGGLTALAVFARLDAASGEDRLLPRDAFDPRRPVGAALMAVLAMSVATMGLPAYGPLLMALIHDTPAIVAGYVVAVISIAWTFAAVAVSGAQERFDPLVIGVGMGLVLLSVAGAVVAVPAGPVGLIALFAAFEGLGFGMAWTFILRRGTRFAAEGEVERLTAALPVVARLGYALGASAVGIFANRAGFDGGATAEEAQHVARMIFLGSLPIAALSFAFTLRFVTARR